MIKFYLYIFFFFNIFLFLYQAYLYNKAISIENEYNKKNDKFYSALELKISRFPLFVKKNNFNANEASEIITHRNKISILLLISMAILFFLGFKFVD